MKPEAWFKVGDAPGLRVLKEQISGLEVLAEVAPRATILDLGCAEGLIGKYYVDTFGADLVHGIESVAARVEQAKVLCEGYAELGFFSADLNDRDALDRGGELLDSYDIVLALAILHKLKNPEAALLWCAGKCARVLAVRMPNRNHWFEDARSGGKRFEPEKTLAADWTLLSANLGPRAERTLVFKRKS